MGYQHPWMYCFDHALNRTLPYITICRDVKFIPTNVQEFFIEHDISVDFDEYAGSITYCNFEGRKVIVNFKFISSNTVEITQIMLSTEDHKGYDTIIPTSDNKKVERILIQSQLMMICEFIRGLWPCEHCNKPLCRHSIDQLETPHNYDPSGIKEK